MTTHTNEKVMSFLQHLEELRWMLIRCVIAVAVGAILAWMVSGTVLEWLIHETSGSAIFMKPQGAFLARLKVALVLGVLATLPYLFYQLWSFVGPGLLSKERKVVLPGAGASVLLFYLGILFSYFLLTPLTVKVLLGFGTASLSAQTEVHFLLDLVFMMGLASGLIFQLPLFAAFLAGTGILNVAVMKKTWRHSVVGIFVIAAVLTPADPLSQMLLAAPLSVLYLVSFVIVAIIGRRRRPQEPEHDEGPESEDSDAVGG